MKTGDILLLGLVGLVAFVILGNREIQSGQIGPIGKAYGGLMAGVLEHSNVQGFL